MTIRGTIFAALLALALAGDAAAQTVERATATAQDGAVLVLRRFKVFGGAASAAPVAAPAGAAVPGGVPVLMLHGLGSNLEEWDLPSKSFARELAAQGFDVWAASHRRTGKSAQWRSSGRVGYSFDDLVALDVPALVAKVRAETGERPFLVCHSMGGMMGLGWLSGVGYESVVVRRRLALGGALGVRLEDVHATRVVGSAARAAARNSEVRGIVSIASPPRLRWPENRATAFDFWRYNFWDYNILLRDLSWSPASTAGALAFREVPSGELMDVITTDLPNFPYIGPHLQPFLRAVTAQVGRSFLSSQLIVGSEMEPQVLVEGLQAAVDDTSGTVFLQFMDGVRTESFRDLHIADPLRRPYIYGDGWSRVTAPALIVGGRRDKLCNDDTLQQFGFARLGSADKTYLSLDGGHVDMVIGRDAPRDLWAPVVQWLRTH